MNRVFVILFIVSVLLLACNSGKKMVLNHTNLPGFSTSVTVGRAYTLTTSKGAVIKIAANSFDAPSDGSIEIEIKEAYTMQDILLAGLSTESNGQLLRSGGMIYIDATYNSKSISILKPIGISIPSNVFDHRMKLFKGEMQEDGNINWVDPQPLDSGEFAKRLAKGEAIFKANCANCHKPNEDFTGPALAGCRQRGSDGEWAYRFTNNVNSMIATDNYAKFLVKKYGSRMTQFNLKHAELQAIFDYCDNEADLNPKPIDNSFPAAGFPDSAVAETYANPCGLDTVYIPKPLEDIAVWTDRDTVPLSSPTIDTNTVPSPTVVDTIPAEASSTEGFRGGFNDPNPTIGMYDFTIKTLGWYNIDDKVAGYEGTTYVDVNIQLQVQEGVGMNVYLFYPAKKMLATGTQHGNNSFNFDKVDGKIPLYLDESVIVIAIGSKGEEAFYGVSTFKVKQSQTINLTVKSVSPETVKDFIKNNNIEGITIDIDKKENFYITPEPCGSVPGGVDAMDIQRINIPDPL